MPYKEFVPEKLFYSISEVSEILGENASLVRFWSDKFSGFVKPERNNKGNRKFTPKDVETLKVIHYLVKERGMTLEGAADRLRENRGGLERKTEVVERLQGIKAELQKISRSFEVEEENLS